MTMAREEEGTRDWDQYPDWEVPVVLESPGGDEAALRCWTEGAVGLWGHSAPLGRSGVAWI